MPWFHGRGLLVRLSSRDASVEEVRVDSRVYGSLLGGRGLAGLVWAWLAGYPSRDPPSPLDPENPLVVAPGGLVGSPLSTASKTAVVARSPLTGFLGRSMVGARLAWDLRRLGYDFLAIVGGLDEPGILVVDDEGVRVESAGDLWGARIGEVRRRLQERYKGYSDMIIGPAGENLSRIAMIDANGRQAGRTGLGAVMGSKRLKAILVKGRGASPRPADPVAALRLAARLNKETREHKASVALVEYGTPAMVNYTGRLHGVLPSLNWKRSTLSWCRDPERALEELAHFAPEKRVSRNPCPGCGRPCSQVLEANGGHVDGPEYETVYALGTDIGVCDIDAIARLNLLADELGFDTISAGATIAWAIHAGEEGLLEGAPRWGDWEAVARLLEDMAYRRGRLGSLLADGTRAAVERLGKGGELALHVKGLEPPAYDARGLKGMALGYAVSSRGADHLTSGAYAVELTGKLWKYSGVDRLSYEGKGRLVAEMEDLMAYFDNTGICKFSRYTLTPEKVAPLWEAVTGIPLDAEGLLEAGARTVELERLLNLWMGLDPARDDDLPERLKREPISDGPSKGEVVDPDKFKAMRDEYYRVRGWQGGIPGVEARERLVEMLGLITYAGRQ